MKDAYLEPYRDAIDAHGPTFASTLWASERTQKVRFEVFTQMLFLAGKRVLDAGCSRGDLASFLVDRDIAYGHYVGVDGLPGIIEEARRLNIPRAEFHAGDLVADPSLLAIGSPQVVTISGTLNTMDESTSMRLLAAAWGATSEALIFNFLSDRCGPRATPQAYPAHRLPTMKLLDWAFTRTPDVQFRQDYFLHGHDATILMRKAEQKNHAGEEIAENTKQDRGH